MLLLDASLLAADDGVGVVGFEAPLSLAASLEEPDSLVLDSLLAASDVLLSVLSERLPLLPFL